MQTSEKNCEIENTEFINNSVSSDSFLPPELNDYEDDSYENPIPDEESERESDPEIMDGGEGTTLPATPEIEHAYTSLMHRYNFELTRMNSMRTQSVFIITAIGFLITLGVSIMGANWFELESLMEIPFIIYLCTFVPVLLCVFNAGKVIFSIEQNKSLKNKKEYFWEFPPNSYLELCSGNQMDIGIDRRQECRELAEIILHNDENNGYARIKVNKAFLWLVLSFGYVITLFLFIGLVNLNIT